MPDLLGDRKDHHPQAISPSFGRGFEVLEGQNGSKRVNMSLSEHVKMGQLIGRGVSELIGE